MTREELARLGPEARKQIAQYMGEVKTGKYRNIRTQVDGIPFDSQKEARRFIELRSLQKAWMIRNLKLQPKFTLQESYVTPEGERVRAVRYVADAGAAGNRNRGGLRYEKKIHPKGIWTVSVLVWEYILESENGASLKASGWKCVGQAGGLRWTGKRRPEVDLYPAQMKIRFERTDGMEADNET